MRTLDQRFRDAAARHQDATALALGSDTLTYAALERVSSQVARVLIDAGVRPGDRVCLVLEKSVRTITTILGVLKCGAIYVPLDPDSPAARLRSMIETCDTRWILASARTAGAIAGVWATENFSTGHVIGWIDNDVSSPATPMFTWNDVSRQPAESVGRATMDAPAYILFTSGSTGTPKGVVISHANVAAFLDWAVPYFAIGSSDRLSGH